MAITSIALLQLMLVIHLPGPASPKPQMETSEEVGGETNLYDRYLALPPAERLPHDTLRPLSRTARHPHDPLRWVWIDDASLGLEWPSRFSLSINGAVTAYGLSLTHPQHHQPSATTTMYHTTTLRHQFEGLSSNVTYAGRLMALVGQHHWPYSLLNFTLTSPTLLTGLGLGQRVVHGRPASTIADLTIVTISARLRWSPSPFLTGGVRPPQGSEDPPDAGGRPLGYRLRLWHHRTLVTQVTTHVNGRNNGCEAAVGGLELDTIYKATVEAVLADGQPGGPSLSFSLDAGALHVEGGGRTTDGVSECYSGLQVRCPGSERCVSPYWICDGANDCPDGADEVGCERSPCEGFRCWDDVCIAGAWRCDGHRDCKGGDDEYACPECRPWEVRCPQGGACVPLNATCDGVRHCSDGWDESVAVCGFPSCGAGELRCLDGGRCVGHQRLCDGVPDCPTSEDEDTTFCAAFTSMKDMRITKESKPEAECERGALTETVNCTEEEFECDSGKCIRRLYVCNGVDDCEAGEDEVTYACVVARSGVEKVDNRIEDTNSLGDTLIEEDVAINEVEGFESPCADRRLRCEKEHDRNSHSSTDLENATANSSFSSITIDAPPTEDIDTESTPDDRLQEIDSDNSLENVIEDHEISTSDSSTITGNITLEVLDEDVSILDEKDVSILEEKDISILEEKDVLLEDEKEVNIISLTESIEDRKNTPLTEVDVNIEVVVEESPYPDGEELDSSGLEEYDNSLEPQVDPLEANLLLIARNMTSATTTYNTTSVLDTLDDFDVNSTTPYLTVTANDTDEAYDSSSSDGYESREEPGNLTTLECGLSESSTSREVSDIEPISLEEEKVFSIDYDQLNDTISASFNDTVSASFNDTVSASFNDTVSASFNDTVSASFNDTVSASFNDTVSAPFNVTVSAPFNDTVSASLNDSVSAPFNDTVSASFNDTVSASFNETVSASFNDTVSVSFNDTVSVSFNDTVSAPFNDTVSASFNDTASVSFNDTVSAPFNDTVSASFNDTVSASFNDTISASFNDTASVSFNDNSVSFNDTTSVSFNDTVSAPFNDTVSAPFNDTISTSFNNTVSASINDTISTSFNNTVSASINDTVSAATSISNQSTTTEIPTLSYIPSENETTVTENTVFNSAGSDAPLLPTSQPTASFNTTESQIGTDVENTTVSLIDEGLSATTTTLMGLTLNVTEEAVLTTMTSSSDHEDSTLRDIEEEMTDGGRVTQEYDTEIAVSTTAVTASTVTYKPMEDPADTTTKSTSFTTEPSNWKAMPIGQQNLTILIAVHSETNESKIPQYIIHGMDGSTYEYEIVSIVKDDDLAKEKRKGISSDTSVGAAGKEMAINEETGKKEMPINEEKGKADGSHSYLQGIKISAASRSSLSLISLSLIVLIYKL